ncbi:hydrolase, partial [Enterococcus faecium]|nr:hydrolase [Enterococcus faecium]
EMVTQKTAEKMNEGQVVAEVYPQILGLNQTLEEAYMSTVIKNVSTEDFFNYCRLEESGVTVTSGTDLPLFITDIPESIIRAV